MHDLIYDKNKIKEHAKTKQVQSQNVPNMLSSKLHCTINDAKQGNMHITCLAWM